MLTFNLEKEWFNKIKAGEKTHEYREVKEYWFKRLFYSCNPRMRCLHEECIFVCGYAPKEDLSKRLKAKIKNVSIVNGKNTDLKIDKFVYDIEFEIIKMSKKMSKKEIIIDGVNVNECEFLWKEKLPKKVCNNGNLDCNSNPNYYYKQLKRKEQALEEIEKILDNGTADTQTNNAKQVHQWYLARFCEIRDIINKAKKGN